MNTKLIIYNVNAAIVRGKIQYPNIHTDWKNDNVPPNNCAFNVTAAAPAHTTTNTVAKTNEAESLGADILNVVDNNKHTNNGPHKSPIYKSRYRYE